MRDPFLGVLIMRITLYLDLDCSLTYLQALSSMKLPSQDHTIYALDWDEGEADETGKA